MSIKNNFLPQANKMNQLNSSEKKKQFPDLNLEENYINGMNIVDEAEEINGSKKKNANNKIENIYSDNWNTG